MDQPQYIAGQRFVWVECDIAGYEGFRAEVRQNLRQGERNALREALAAIEDIVESVQLQAMERAQDIDARVAQDDLTATQQMALRAEQRRLLSQFNLDVERELQAQHRLIAPHVRAWNLYAVADDGEPVPVPPPSVAGDEVFDQLDRPLIAWLIRELLMAYRGGKGLTASVMTSGEQPEHGGAQTQDGPQVIELPNTRRSRQK
jgi:hypothetical protein